MAERVPNQRRQDSGSRPGTTADEVEQRQRPDGSFDDTDTVDVTEDQPLSPDMLEQRQGLDGGMTQDELDDLPDGPLTADMLEQRRVIEDDEWEDRRE